MNRAHLNLLPVLTLAFASIVCQAEAADTKFEIIEECGPSYGGHRGGVGPGWERSYAGILKNGQYSQATNRTDNDNGGQQLEELSLNLTADGRVQFNRRRSNSITGDASIKYIGQIQSGQKQIKISGRQSYSNGRIRACTAQITFLEAPVISVSTEAKSRSASSQKALTANRELAAGDENKKSEINSSISKLISELNEAKAEIVRLRIANEEARSTLRGTNNATQSEIEKLKTQAAEQEKLKIQSEIARNQLAQSNISAQSEIDRLKKQIKEQEVKGSRLVTTDQFIFSSKSRIETLKTLAISNRDIEVAMRNDYEVRIKSQVQQLRSRISLLTTAKATAANSDEIKFLQSQIDALISRSLADEEAFKKLLLRNNEIESEVGDLRNTIKTELEKTKQDLDEKRRQDFDTLSKNLNDIGSLIEATRQATQREIASLKQYTDSELAKLKQDQISLEKRLTTTNQILANLILPISERPEDWMMRVAAVPVQQQQFCRIVDRFYDDLDNVYKTRNDIKKNALFRDRHQDLAALLPGGAINSWIVRVIEVTQAPDGSAAVLLQPPCRAMLGSDACGADQKKIRATIPQKSLMYRELSRVNTGDFVTISGKIIYAQESYVDQPLPQYALYQAGKHCTDVNGAKSQDVFVTEITNLAVLK